MELQEMTSVTFMEEVLMPFCVQFNNGHTCLMTKDNTFVLIDEYNYSNHLNYFNSIRTKISCPKHVPTKEIDCNPLTIFEKGTLDEKQALMLDQTLMPGLSSPYIQSIKALVSTHDTNNPVLLAYLSSFGGLEISTRKNSNEWKQIADISKLNANKRKICNVFTDLQTTVNDIMIESIEWCNKIFHHTRYLLIKTKSEKLLIYAFKTNELREIEIKQCYSQQIEGIRLVKWVSTSKQEFLFLTDEVGNISIYNVNMKEDDIEELNLLEEVSARLKLPTSFITFTVTDKHILIVCSKSHSLEAFCFDKVGKFMSSTVQYVGLNVTGLLCQFLLPYQ